MEVLYAVEGATDAPVAEKLIAYVGGVPRVVVAEGGKSAVDARVKRWSQSSNRQRILVLRDWDRSDRVECAPELIRTIFDGRVLLPNLVVRVAVRRSSPG